ncbi:MAG: diguanylate cyclase domain-containing protein [Thermoanaerobaculia bacterium]
MTRRVADPGIQILLVEDDAGMRSSIRDSLTDWGPGPPVDVAEASSYEEAMSLLAGRSFDVLLLDHLLASGRTGLDVLVEARDGGVQAPAIMITGHGHEDFAVAAMKAGAADYLVKTTLTVDGIRHSVRRALDLAEKERLRQEAEEKLRQSEERHRSLIENSYDAIAVLDERGRLKYASPATARLLGFAPMGFVGKSAFAFVHPDERDEVGLLFEECRRTPDAVVRSEFRLLHRDGSWRWMEGIGTNRFQRAGIDGMILNFRDISDRKRFDEQRQALEEQIHFQAFHDALTGLPNRSLFEDRLSLAIAQADRNAEGLGVMFLDLDNFKTINDGHGHLVGDGILKTVANRLRGCIREHDSVARIGGDEFLFLFPELGDLDDADRVSRKLLRQFSRPFEVLGLSLTVTASIGVALYRLHGMTADQLMKNADSAMYRAKSLGRSRAFFLRGEAEAAPPTGLK